VTALNCRPLETDISTGVDMLEIELKSLRARPVIVPLRRPVIADIGRFDQWPMILIDIETSTGVVGRSYLAPYRAKAMPAIVAVLHDLAGLLQGKPTTPADAYAQALKALNVVGVTGLSLIAIAGLDMALWDALAKSLNAPLATVLGGSIGPVRAYNSNGLWRHEVSTIAAEARALRDEGGFTAMKLRLGNRHLEDDVAAIDAVHEGVGRKIDLMVDFNQALGSGDAIRRCHELDDKGLYWFEEPIAYDNVRGYAQLAGQVRTPLQMGENYYGPRDLFTFMQAGGVDYAMGDLMRIGGVSGWMQAAHVAACAGIQFSNHLYPEISSHLLRVSPSAHWLEYVDWANPILAEPLVVTDGLVTAPDTPGIGIDWNEKAVEKYAVA
jgi:mandelate racemase